MNVQPNFVSGFKSPSVQLQIIASLHPVTFYSNLVPNGCMDCAHFLPQTFSVIFHVYYGASDVPNSKSLGKRNSLSTTLAGVRPVVSCTADLYANSINGRSSSQSSWCSLTKILRWFSRVLLNRSTIPSDCGLEWRSHFPYTQKLADLGFEVSALVGV